MTQIIISKNSEKVETVQGEVVRQDFTEKVGHQPVFLGWKR